MATKNAPVEVAPGPSAQEPGEPQREPVAELRRAFRGLRSALDELERVALSAAQTPARDHLLSVPIIKRDVMKPREYAQYKAVNVHKVHGWIEQGMPHFLEEGRIRLRPAQADGWLLARKAEGKTKDKPKPKPKAKDRAKEKLKSKDKAKDKKPRPKVKSQPKDSA